MRRSTTLCWGTFDTHLEIRDLELKEGCRLNEGRQRIAIRKAGGEKKLMLERSENIQCDFFLNIGFHDVRTSFQSGICPQLLLDPCESYIPYKK